MLKTIIFRKVSMGPFTQAVFASKNLFTQEDVSKLADMADDQRLQLVRQVNGTAYHTQ